MDTTNLKKINKLLVKLKTNAFILHRDGYFPSFIFEDICKLGVDTSENDLRIYMDLSERYLRVKGYYFKHKDEINILRLEYEKIKEERGLING